MNKHLLILTIILISATLGISQTYVSPGDGTLYSALEEAEDGFRSRAGFQPLP